MNVYDTDARFVIDPVSGDIENKSLKETIARYSHNSEVFTFEIPRNIGHDPVECNLIEIHYININARNKTETSEGIYKVNDICECSEDATKAVFTWKIDGSATAFAGTLSFSIHFKCIDSEGKCLYRLPIKTYSKITVTDAIDNSRAVIEEHHDIIAEWEARISAAEESSTINKGVFYVDVSMNGENAYLNTNYDDVVSAFNNDKTLVCRMRDTEESVVYAYLMGVGDETFVFVADLVVVTINEASCEIGVTETVKEINTIAEEIGNISSAIDHIIELQEELIGL